MSNGVQAKRRTLRRSRYEGGESGRVLAFRSPVDSSERSSESASNEVDVVCPSDAHGLESVRKAGNREMLLFAQIESRLLRQQEAVFRAAEGLLERVPEVRREGVRSALASYQRTAQSWYEQMKAQESEFLAAQDKDHSARGQFMLAEKQLEESAKTFAWIRFFSAKNRRDLKSSVSRIAEHAALIRESLHEQSVHLNRYLRFREEWESCLKETLAFIGEQVHI